MNASTWNPARAVPIAVLATLTACTTIDDHPTGTGAYRKPPVRYTLEL